MIYKVSYRNRLGGNREIEFHKGPSIFSDIDSADEARQELLRTRGHDFDDTPLRIEYIDANGIHTDTWTCDDAFDSVIRHQWQKGAV